MKKDSSRNFFKSFVKRFESHSRNRRAHIIAGITCVALAAIICAVLFIVEPTLIVETTPAFGEETTSNFGDVGDAAFVQDTVEILVKDGEGALDTNTDPDAPDYMYRRGNDSSNSNKKIRSYDTIIYTITLTTELTDTNNPVEEGFLWYECELPCSGEQAMFDMTSLGDNYTEQGMDVLAESNRGGYVIEEKVVGEAVTQHLTGKLLLSADGDNTGIPGTKTFDIRITVKRMYEGDIVTPKFTFYLQDNQPDVKRTVEPDPITVTSELRMNVQLLKVNESKYLRNVSGIFDFTTGNDLALDKEAGSVYGVISAYGITLQICNDNNGEGRNLKGCELPDGDITFDLNLEDIIYKKATDGETVDLNKEDFMPLIWSYDASISYYAQQDAREVNTYRGDRNVPGAAPAVAHTRRGRVDVQGYNTNAMPPFIDTHYCSGGGEWRMERDSENKNILHVTVTDYYPKRSDGTIHKEFTFFPNVSIGGTGGPGKAYLDPYAFNPANPMGSSRIGCFTAGELFLVVPLSDKNGTLREQYGEGTLSLTIEDSNLSVGSQNPNDYEVKKRNQTNILDDDVTYNYTPKVGGTYGSKIYYSNDEQARFDIQVGSQWVRNGLDLAPVGQENRGVTWGLDAEVSDASSAVYAANLLMKFDDEAFEIQRSDDKQHVYAPSISGLGVDDQQGLSKTAKYTYLYATKPNGTGWDSDDDMENAKTEDLVYYESLEELEKAGKVCVGVLLEFRDSNPTTGGSVKIGSFARMKIKDDYDKLVGNTYQTVIYSTVWTGVYPGYDKVPSMMDSEPLPDGMLLNCTNGKPLNYFKTEYDESGKATHYSSNYALGDSVRIVGYKATIAKEVTNKKAVDGSIIFNLDNKERTVEYKISPKVNYSSDSLNSVYSNKTTVTIVDTIPKGLIYNNDYLFSQGYDDYDKDNVEFNATYNENGDTVLTWILTGVTVGQKMPEITYSCNISDNPADGFEMGKAYANTVTISVPGGFPIDVRNSNIASVQIKAVGTSMLSFSKFADKPLYEQGEDMSWTMYVGNNSDSKYVDEVWLDVLPYNGDGYGSDFDFPLRVVSWTIDRAMAPSTSGTWKAYYTTDVNVRTTKANAYTSTDIEKGTSGGITWKPLTINSDGSISGLPEMGKAQPTALAVIGDLGKNETYKSNVVVNSNDLQKHSMPADKLVNRLSRGSADVTGVVSVVSRSISGLVWWDENSDGIRDAEEKTATNGIKVTLMKLNDNGEYEPFMYNGEALSVPAGTRISGLTGKTEPISAGSYDFIDLPAGTYGVRFESEDGNNDFKMWKAALENVGEDDKIDSDAVPTYEGEKLLRTDITGIELPQIESMFFSDFKSEHNDSGLCAGGSGAILPLTGGTGTNSFYVISFAFIVFSSFALCYKRKRKVVR